MKVRESERERGIVAYAEVVVVKLKTSVSWRTALYRVESVVVNVRELEILVNKDCVVLNVVEITRLSESDLNAP